MKFYFLFASIILFYSSAFGFELVLKGLPADPNFIKMSRLNDHFKFEICDSTSCQIIGKTDYSMCEMKDYLKEMILRNLNSL